MVLQVPGPVRQERLREGQVLEREDVPQVTGERGVTGEVYDVHLRSGDTAGLGPSTDCPSMFSPTLLPPGQTSPSPWTRLGSEPVLQETRPRVSQMGFRFPYKHNKRPRSCLLRSLVGRPEGIL